MIKLIVKMKHYNCKNQTKVVIMKRDEIKPKVLRAFKFHSTAQTPNSEEVKNQYFYRVMVFISGSATVVLGEQRMLCKKNDVLYLLPDTPYQILNTNGNFAVINIYFDYSGDTHAPKGLFYKTLFQNEFVSELCRKKYVFADSPVLNTPQIIQDHSNILDFSFKILKEYEKVPDLCNQKLISLLMSCIIEEMCSRQKNVGRKSDKYMQLIAYIRENAYLKITAEDLSKKFFYHKNHINRIIKSETGMSLKAFILKTKIELAQKLFEETNMNVTEIANYLNFYDTSHFLKIYKKNK